jgi:hypothetical protein
MLDLGILNLLFSFFNITIKSNEQWAMDQQMNPNPMFQLWMKFSINALLCVMFNKFIKVVELVVVQIMEIVEDERTFNNLTFMKTSSAISCVNIWTLYMFMPNHFIQFRIFLTIYDAIMAWIVNKLREGC